MAKQRREILDEFDHINLNQLAKKQGGRFKLTGALTKRVRELVKLRLVDESRGYHPIDVAIKEVEDGKVSLAPADEEEKEQGSEVA